MKKEYVSPVIWVRNVNVRNSILVNSPGQRRFGNGTSINAANNTTGLFGGSNGDITLDNGIGVSNESAGDEIWGNL